MKPSERVNVLVVDDQPEKASSIESTLAELDQNIVKATSGREALRCLSNDDFAMILLDASMPEMDGFETAARIRERKRSEHTPIIFITTQSDDCQLAKGYALGAVDFISTPVDPDVLRSKVRVFVDLYQKTESIRQQAAHRVQLAREQAARQAAEKAMRRSALLAEASRLLSRSLDFNATLASLHRAVVPALADACQLVLDDPNGGYWFAPVTQPKRKTWTAHLARTHALKWFALNWPMRSAKQSKAAARCRSQQSQWPTHRIWTRTAIGQT